MIGWGLLGLLLLALVAGMVAVTSYVLRDLRKGVLATCLLLGAVTVLYAWVYGAAHLIKNGI